MTKRIKARGARRRGHRPSRPSWPVAPPPADRPRDGDTVSVVGFSVLEDGQQAGHRRLPEDRRRQGRQVQDVVRRLRRPEPRRRRRPEGRRRALLARARRHPPRRRGLVAKDWNDRPRPRASSPTPSWSSWSARATPRTSRPGTTWSSPASRSSPRTRPRPARPSGTSSPPAAHVAGQRRHRGRRQGVPHQVLRQHRRPARAAAATPPPRSRRHRRRAALLRERGDPGPRRAATDFDYIVPDDTLLIENPGAVTEGRRRRRPRTSWTSSSADGRPDRLRQGRLPPGHRRRSTSTVEGANDPSNPFPAPARSCSRSTRTSAAGPRPTTKFFDDERPGIITKIQDAGQTSASDVTAVLGTGRAGPVGARRRPGSSGSTLTRGSGLGLGVAMIWFSLLVLIPLAAIVVTAGDGGWQRLRRHAHQPADLGRAQADRRSVARSSPLVNVVMGTLIAWVLVRDRFSGKRRPRGASSTSRSRCRRSSPAWCCSSLYGPKSPLGVDVGQHPRPRSSSRSRS